MEQHYEVMQGVHVLPAWLPVPTLGLLSVHAFLVEAEQPYLVDTGLPADAEAFRGAVESLIDPRSLRWIYLTHTDPDHIGALSLLLERAPNARVITTFVGLAKLQVGLRAPSPDRVLLANPGERIDLGDRTLVVMRPPIFDAPETTMVGDSRLDALFSADVFGAPLDRPVRLAEEIPDPQLATAEVLWATIDSPWIHQVSREGLLARLREIGDLNPQWIFSAHLPPARAVAKKLCENLARAPQSTPFVAPDQAAFEAILRAPR